MQGHFIGGEEALSPSFQEWHIKRATDGEVIAKFAQSNPADVEPAVKAALAGFEQWQHFCPSEQEACFLEASSQVAKTSYDLRELIIDETGSTITKANFEVSYTAQLLRAAAGEVRRLYGETIPADKPNRRSQVIRQPLGVVGVISPFNAPLALLAKMTAFPVAAGNAVIIKPSEWASMVAWEFTRLLCKSGFPPGLINTLFGKGPEVGKVIVKNPQIDAITFTGSTSTGVAISHDASPHVKRLHLELGGNNAVIICSDFPLDLAARKTCYGAFFHGGQICMASRRVLVHEDIYEDFCNKLVHQAEKLTLGDLRNPKTAYGPLINDFAIQKVHKHMESALKSGGELFTGGELVGNRTLSPAVISQPSTDCEAWQEETFGPLCLVKSFGTKEEALELANQTSYGLSAGVMTYDLRLADYFSRNLKVGAVHIGSHSFHSEAMAPLGGEGHSGLGRSGGKYSIEAFVQQKWISTEMDPGPFPEGY